MPRDFKSKDKHENLAAKAPDAFRRERIELWARRRQSLSIPLTSLGRAWWPEVKCSMALRGLALIVRHTASQILCLCVLPYPAFLELFACETRHEVH